MGLQACSADYSGISHTAVGEGLKGEKGLLLKIHGGGIPALVCISVAGKTLARCEEIPAFYASLYQFCKEHPLGRVILPRPESLATQGLRVLGCSIKVSSTVDNLKVRMI